MADETPKPVEGAPPEEPEAKAPATPTTEELVSALEQERIRAARAEQDADMMRQQMFTQRPQAPMPQGPDPLEQFTENIISGDPKQNKRALEAALNQRIARAVNAAEQRFAAAFNETQANNDAQRVLDGVMYQNPDLRDPSKQRAYTALVTKAHMDAQAQGLRLPMDQIAQRALREYRQLYGPTPTQNKAPFVEGASIPGQGMGTPQGQPVEKNLLEDTYGFSAGEIEPITWPAMQKISRDYVKEKNDFARKKGMGTSVIVTPRTEAM